MREEQISAFMQNRPHIGRSPQMMQQAQPAAPSPQMMQRAQPAAPTPQMIELGIASTRSFVTDHQFEDSVYSGELKNGVPCGHGKRTYRDDTYGVYTGEFNNGVFHGHGHHTIPHRGGTSVYVGEFKDDQQHGHGHQTITVQGVTFVYVGEFKGEPYGHGHLKVTSASGNTIDEDCVGEGGGSLRTMKTIQTYANGDVLDAKDAGGTVAAQKLIGRIAYSNGDVYEGRMLVIESDGIEAAGAAFANEVTAPRIDSVCTSLRLQGTGTFVEAASGLRTLSRLAANKWIGPGVQWKSDDGLSWLLHDGKRLKEISLEEADKWMAGFLAVEGSVEVCAHPDKHSGHKATSVHTPQSAAGSVTSIVTPPTPSSTPPPPPPLEAANAGGSSGSGVHANGGGGHHPHPRNGAGGGGGGGGGGRAAERHHEWLVSVATGDCAMVLQWLAKLGYHEYHSHFQQLMVDGKTLRTLSEAELEGLGVSSAIVRRRMALEIDELRSAMPPPLPPPVRRLTSEPERGYRLEEVTEPLEPAAGESGGNLSLGSPPAAPNEEH